MSDFRGPPDSYYDPPDPPEPCCELYEEDDDHDVESCLAEQAEDAAEAKDERMREDDRDAYLEQEGWFDSGYGG